MWDHQCNCVRFSSAAEERLVQWFTAMRGGDARTTCTRTRYPVRALVPHRVQSFRLIRLLISTNFLSQPSLVYFHRKPYFATASMVSWPPVLIASPDLVGRHQPKPCYRLISKNVARKSYISL